METQTLTQTINIIIGGDGLANTGVSTTLYTIIGAGLIIVAVLFLFRHSRNSHFKLGNLTKNRNLNFRGLSIFFLLALFTASLTLSPLSGTISAAPTLSLDTNQEALTVTVPEGGGTASTTTTLTTGTANSSGYTLTAALSEAETGISIKLRGGSITTATALNAGDPALTLKTTESTTSNDTTEVTLDFTIDSTVTAGTKDLKLSYAISDNEATSPTMQSFTPEQCDALATYTGTNEEAVIALTDSRGGTTQTYQVAKLADDNCWMLNNLKLGSTTSSITLTPSDTNIASNLTLPQLSTPTFTEEPDEATINDLFDNPHVYGPVPGDTGTGETNYGYLYNWSAATGGESRASHTEADGDAPYSICPANWRLPTASRIYNEDTEQYDVSGDFPELDQAFGGTGEGSYSGEPNIAQWHYDGAFKGVFSGYWVGEFDGQGDYGLFWSASAHPDTADGAFYAYFNASEVNPADGSVRYAGFSVRCLLQ
jgi:uncharacterized protein (TIGR02145 family)/LPXTG-motif cell wall-anchored protein